MKLTPSFVVASLVCAAPFALAVKDELGNKDHLRAAFEADRDDFGMGHRDDDSEYRTDPYESIHDVDQDRVDHEYAIEPPEPARTTDLKADELPLLLGAETAAMGPVLAGLSIGAPSTSFLPDETRERIETFKLDHDISVDFDFDDITLNGVTLRVPGEESALRDALLAMWPAPRRLSEDELSWSRPDGMRAVYTAMSDGFELRFEKFSTIDAIIAPKDRTKLGVEPFPLVGGSFAKLEKALGPRLQESSYEDERSWTLPGLEGGSGKTMVHVTLDPTLKKIETLTVEASSANNADIRAALSAKWGAPKEDDTGVLVWKKNGVTISVEQYERGFVLTEGR